MIETALNELIAATPHVTGALVASVDGLPVAHDLRTGDPDAIAAMAATTAGLSQRIAGDFDHGEFAETTVRGADGFFVVYSVGSTAVLAVIAAAEANLGRVHLNARRCAAVLVPQPQPQ